MNNERIILADKQTSILLFTVIDIVITYEEDGNIVSYLKNYSIFENFYWSIEESTNAVINIALANLFNSVSKGLTKSLLILISNQKEKKTIIHEWYLWL